MCKTWQDTKIHPRPRTEDAKFETSRGVIIEPAVEAGFGDARRRGGGATGGCRIQGNLEKAWKREDSKSRDLSLKHSRKMPDSGRPEEASEGGTVGVRSRGNLGTCCEGPLKDGRFEETRRTVAGTVRR